MVGKPFVLAGRAVFTIELPADYAKDKGLPPHLTYKVRRSKDGKVYFLSKRMGATYEYVGLLEPDTATVRTTKKSVLPTTDLSVRLVERTLRRLWANDAAAVAAAGFDVHHEGQCGRCGRKLTVPESIEHGIGPECAKAVQW